MSDLLKTLISEETKLKAMVCQCYFDIISKISGLDIPNDKEDLLSLTINECNKSSNSIIERTEQWFDLIKIKLADVSHIINVDDLASGVEAPSGAASGSATATESSGVTSPSSSRCWPSGH